MANPVYLDQKGMKESQELPCWRLAQKEGRRKTSLYPECASIYALQKILHVVMGEDTICLSWMEGTLSTT